VLSAFDHEFTFIRYTSYFALLSAAAHWAVLSNWDRYEADLKKGLNRFRWAEYSLSASLIMTLLFLLWGNLDWTQVAGCFVSNVLMCQFGDLHELINSGCSKKDVKWSAFYYGAIVGVVPWGMMIMEIIRIFSIYDSSVVPWWVWLFVLEYFLLFFTFPYTMYAQYKQWGKYNNELYPLLKNGGYLQGERQY
jgi:hypothetical protein